MNGIVFALKSAIILGLFGLAYWSFGAFTGEMLDFNWQLFLLLPALAALPASAQWKRLPLREMVSRLLVHDALIFAFAFFSRDVFLISAYVFYNALLLFFSWMLREGTKSSLGNFAVTLFTSVLMLGLLEFAAPSIQDWVIRQQAAANQAEAAAIPSWTEIEFEPQEQPVASSPVTEVLEEGPGPHWGPLTGWGTRTNARVHRSLGTEFDVMLSYNSLGLRGAEIAYEKPEDVYRILLIGDSYIEAREVNDDETVYAQLNRILADYRTSDGRRIEVFGAGATGWGTAQSYLYYHVEGYRFSPDLIINVFIINDVVDNYPAQFYPERGIDFIIDDEVRIISSSESQPQTQPMVGWLNALPEALQGSRTIQLLRQLFFPPLTPLTAIRDTPQSHPQDYIFLRQPALDGYPEAWERTERVYQLWDAEAEAKGAELMVLQVDVGVSYLRGLVDRHVDQPSWVWDADLPTSRLQEILEPLGIPLIETRDYYEAYASEEGLLVRDALFFPSDGHWNPTGHLVTAQRLFEVLHERAIIISSESPE